MARSAHLSSVPRFRSGNIQTPPSHVVTDRKSSRIIMGRDDAPQPALTFTKVRDEIGRKITTDSLASERANVRTSTVQVRILTAAERSADDSAAGLYRDSQGHVVRTADMGEETTLADEVAARRAAASTNVKPLTMAERRRERNEARKIQREQEDAAVRAVCAAFGWKSETGEITPLMRANALEMIEVQRQVAAH